MLDETDNDDIKTYLAELRAVLLQEDVDAIKEAITKLESVSHKFAEAMYAEASGSMDDLEA